MLSVRAHYAFRAMVLLAAEAGREPLSSRDIARATHTSVKFLEAILSELRKAGLLRSYRGSKGGFVLARPPENITLADIVRVTEGSLGLAPCVSDVAPAQCLDCFDQKHCQLRRALAKARDETVSVLRSFDLKTTAAQLQAKRQIPALAGLL